MKIADIVKGAKIPLYFTSVAPVITAAVLIRIYEPIIFLVLLTVVLMQSALNTSMDFYDVLNGRHLMNSDTLFPLGSYFIEKLHVEPRIVLLASRVLLLLAAISGLSVIAITRDLDLLWLGLIAIFFALIYVIPPIRLGSRGIGELSTFVDFGIFPFIGTIIALNGKLSIDDFLLASSFGLLASMIRYLHHLPEDQDSSIRVKNFKIIYLVLIILTFAIILPLRSLIFADILTLIILLYHWYYLGIDKISIARKTNEIVAVDIIFTFLVISTLLFN